MGPDRNQIAQSYVAAFQRDGAATYIANLETHVDLLDWGDQTLPITINNGTAGRTFVCSPRVGWIDFTKEELARFPNKWLVPPLSAVINSMGALLRLCDLNRIVHINNWMMSTNLPVDLDTRQAVAQTRALTTQFPDHFLAMRSLTRRQSGPLMQALENAGWIFFPSRQIFIVDDVANQSLTRRDARNDARLWQAKAFTYDEVQDMSDADAARIATLYSMLYLIKYSHLNPAYTADFIKLAHNMKVIRFLALRDESGEIQAFGGFHRFGKHGTMPLLGYNTDMPASAGLYRLACHAGSLYAARHKLQFNMSSGATLFKRTRGATPEMEYTAFYIKHLPTRRRAPFGILQLVSKYIAIPILEKYNL